MWGCLMAWLDCDWRTTSLKQHFVSEKTLQAYGEIAPTSSMRERRRWLRERFMCAAEEELEGHWLALRRDPKLPCLIDGLPALQQALAAQRGLVLLTFHFDAALWGIGQLGRAGLTLNLMSSAIVEDERVPTIVQSYFQAKYSGLAALFNGGKVMHKETHLAKFYRRLRQGESVVILGDAFATNPDKAIAVEFFGACRLFAPGAVRLAERCGAPLAAFVCLREPQGYRIAISPVFWPDGSGSHKANFPSLFAFLEEHVRVAPKGWWAADLLPQFIVSAPVSSLWKRGSHD